MLQILSNLPNIEEYKANEFCKFISCEELEKRLDGRINKCSFCMAYLFHDYLQKFGYHVLCEKKNFKTNPLQIG